MLKDLNKSTIWRRIKQSLDNEMINQLASGDSYMPDEEIHKVEIILKDIVESELIPEHIYCELAEALAIYRWGPCNIDNTEKEKITMLLCAVLLILFAQVGQYDDDYNSDIVIGLDSAIMLGDEWSRLYYQFIEQYINSVDIFESDLIYFYMSLLVLSILLEENQEVISSHIRKIQHLYKNNVYFCDRGNLLRVFTDSTRGSLWQHYFNRTAMHSLLESHVAL